ncbi:EAL domain-containing protein [Rhodocyclus tenuis]|uniref:sensor domain-containing protein n=1 Tax=Rhodocyclus tenuis TaxID=1066 RepID=UPI001904E162|nr:EAL domain-containing protein [Rhodocyclus tenuis]MBK1681293.1 hypothetical protein [Rhodocyclus tenuis]
MPAAETHSLVLGSVAEVAAAVAGAQRGTGQALVAELLHHLVIPAFVVDAEHRVTVWNKACERLTGMPAGEVVGTSDHWRAFYAAPRPCLADLLIDSLTHEIDALYAAHDDSLAAHGAHAENWCVMPLLGEKRYLEIDAGPVHDADGRLLAVVETVRDTTEHKRASDLLQLHASVFDNTHEAIAITDASGAILSVNEAFSRITGYSLDESLGRNPRMLKSGLQDAAFYQSLWQSLGEHGQWRGEIWNRRKNGELFPGILTISAVRRASGKVQHYVALLSDISDLRDTQNRLQSLVNHDPLTGLPNRPLVQDRLAQAAAFADRVGMHVALLLLDLDKFKEINELIGHSGGDELLVAVARRLRECVRETDTVSRQGGDEFLIVLTGLADADAAMPFAEKLLERFQTPFLIAGEEVVCSVSIGVAVFPEDGREFETLLKKADRALHGAKADGRNTCRFFDARMNVEAGEGHRLRQGLRRALERNEFVLHYQPQIDLDSGRVIGAEALIRWQHPEFGLVPPGRFIPVVEESGLIVPIGEWVLREACRQGVAWRDAGLPELVIAVNMSATQFRRDDIEQTVIRALADSGHDPALLELELTESILIGDTERVLDTVRRLKLLGLKLAIDDFGTGYSSFSYLKRFAVDKLKIDQSFIRDLQSDPDDAVIVRTIIQMARSLGLRTVAEGVESAEIAQRLRVFRCDEVQGYYFSRPLPADDFAQFLSARSAVLAATHTP